MSIHQTAQLWVSPRRPDVATFITIVHPHLHSHALIYDLNMLIVIWMMCFFSTGLEIAQPAARVASPLSLCERRLLLSAMLSTLVRAARQPATRRALVTHARAFSRLQPATSISRAAIAVASLSHPSARRHLSTPADPSSSSSLKHAGSSSAAPVEPADEQVRWMTE